MSNSLRSVLEKVLLRGKLKKQYIDCLLSGKNFELYKQSFTHKTHNAETNYEFFEQLGDVSINKFMVSYTYKRFPHLKTPQGVKIVARVRIKYTSRETLSQEAEKLGFWPFILACENTKFRFKKDLLEDCFESFIGVTEYILDTQLKDGVGYCIVKDILTSIFDEKQISLKYEDLFDAKTRLKEIYDGKPNYKIQYVSQKNEEERLVYTTIYEISQHYKNSKVILGSGVAAKQSNSQQNAAKDALHKKKFNHF